MTRLVSIFGQPAFLRGFHGTFTVLWGLLIPVTVFSPLKSSLIWIALMSVWANFASHWSAWQAARVEVRQEVLISEQSP